MTGMALDPRGRSLRILLPAGFIGLMIAAIFAAAMSASGGELNALATATVIDFYRRHWVTTAKVKGDHHRNDPGVSFSHGVCHEMPIVDGSTVRNFFPLDGLWKIREYASNRGRRCRRFAYERPC